MGFEPTLLKFGISFNLDDEMIRLNRSATVSCLLIKIFKKEVKSIDEILKFFYKYKQ